MGKKFVRIPMQDEQFERLMQRAVAEGFPNLESYLCHVAGDRSPYIDVFNQARAAFDKLQPGQQTTVGKLIGPEWDTLPLDVRINVGKMFKSAVRYGLIKVSSLSRTYSNHAYYSK